MTERRSARKITRRNLISTAFQAGIVVALDPKLTAYTGIENARTYPALLPSLPGLPDSAKPWVYWFWFNGNVTHEGLTADLEAMHAIGIGGAIILWTGFGSAPGPVRYMSPVWYDTVQFVLEEAKRLGLQIDVNNDDGWSDAAGPWITPELAMQKVVWTETILEGGKSFSGVLKHPESKGNFYRDIEVLAFPAPAGSDTAVPEPKIRLKTGVPAMVLHDYGTAITARSAEVQLYAEIAAAKRPVVFSLEASDDGEHYRPVYTFDNHWRWTGQEINRSLSLSIHFPATNARFFRLTLPYTNQPAEAVPEGKEPQPKLQSTFKLIGEGRIALWPMKAGYSYVNASLEEPDRYAGGWIDQHVEHGAPVMKEAEPASIIRLADIVRLTENVHNGQLDWTPPQGRWKVLRIGYTIVGAVIHTASKEGRGLVVNPFLREAMDVHFEADLKKLIDKNKQFVGTSLYAYHMDSSETGPSNWSPTLAQEFASRRGYGIVPWLPVIAGGHIVEGLEQSERLLWDFRRTMSDLIAEHCWGRLAELAHEHGGQFSAEASGRMQYLSDPLLYLSKGDLPMAEFWPGEHEVRPDCNNSRAVANVHGKKTVLGEAYTDASWNHSPHAGEWQDHPYSLKAFGDRAFCAGVNKFVFHRSISQPSLHEFPGLAWGTPGGRHVGINMERTNTWWHPGAAWISYLSRCGYLLQSGHEVVDVCCLVDEGAPNRVVKPEGLAKGYRFDGLHPTMLKYVTVEHGELVLPSGMRYRILVLPPLQRMRPETAREVTRLLRSGATIAGDKPTVSPSLSNHPKCDEELRRITGEWKNIHPHVSDALAQVHVVGDLDCAEDIHFMHRVIHGEHYYFLSNQTGRDIRIQPRFRVSGLAPELLDPDTGDSTLPAIYRTQNGTTSVPLTLQRSESLFVVFRRPAKDAVIEQQGFVNNLGSSLDDVLVERLPDDSLRVTSASSRDLKIATQQGRKYEVRLPKSTERELGAPWTLAFPPKWGAPESVELPALISWSEHADPGVRHFSGTATYTVVFRIEPGELGKDKAVFLDLGHVEVIAEATLNGKKLGTRWKPPFRWEVTDAVVPGNNHLQVQVTNLWPNRMIGDSALPESQRFTHTNFNPYQPHSPLLPSGILGPATITFAHRRVLPAK